MKKLFLVLALLFFFPNDVQAVTFSSSLSPSVQHILIKPGVSMRTTFKLHNSGDPITLQLKFAKVQTENERLVFTDIVEGPISFSNPDLNKPFIMTSDEFKDIEVDIVIPENAEQKEIYFAVIAETIPQPAQQGKVTVHLQGAVSSLLLLTVKDDANLDFNPKIVLFDTKPLFRLSLFGRKLHIFDTSKPVPVVLTVQNQGQNTFKAEGWLSLSGPTDAGNTPLSSKYMLADSQVTMSSPLDIYCEKSENEKDDVCASGHSMIFSSLKTGMYTIQASVVAGKQGKAVTASTSFMVLPFKLIGFSLIIALSIPLLMILYIKKKQK